MALLRRWNTIVDWYPETVWTDRDGNIMQTPAKDPIQLKVMIQPLPQSGTSARRAEQDNEGFESETQYRMRTLAGAPHLDQQSRIGWKGQWWAIVGDPVEYRGSSRTAHTDYTIRKT